MTRNERAHLKGFTSNEDTFQIVTRFIADLPEPKYDQGMTLADFGALVLARQQLRKDLEKRFDALKIAAQFDDSTS